MSPVGDYLHDCLAAFPEISARKYGAPFDLSAIERAVRHLRGRRPLTYADLSYFVSAKHWWFEKYWVLPPEDKVSPKLAKLTFDFWNLPKRQDVVLRQLLEVFKSIELVSIILRFVKPETYGIISPPVERVLDVRRGSDGPETYRNYLEDLGAVREHYGFGRAADADMALWALHERCWGTLRDADIAAAYEADPFMLRLRAKNLVGHLLAGRTYGDFAHAVELIDPQLAAVVACYTFELKLRALAAQRGVPPARTVAELIDAFAAGGLVTEVRRGEWRRLKAVRDALFHEGRRPRAEQIAALIREVRRLESDLQR